MKILILGAGKMGSFFCDVLSDDHRVAICDRDPRRLKFTSGAERLTGHEMIADFDPDLVINAVTVRYTIEAFREIAPLLRRDTIMCDIASVKTGLPDYYATCGRPFVSTHPMFGPTFASLANLADENAIIIAESDPRGKAFFHELYSRLGLHIEEYTFDEHDHTIAYSLSIPFASTLVFGAVMKHQSAPGTTFKRHMAIARGLMSEDDYLLTEILFNPHTPGQLAKIRQQLAELSAIIEAGDTPRLKAYLDQVRDNLK